MDHFDRTFLIKNSGVVFSSSDDLDCGLLLNLIFRYERRKSLEFKNYFRDIYFRSTFLLALPILSISCATSNGLRTLSDQAVLLDLPVVRQISANLCGEVALEMLTRYYDVPLSAEQEARLKKEADREKGLSGLALKKTLEEQGYFVAVFSGTLDRKVSGLYHHLDLKRPLIVMIEGSGQDRNHYVLAVGYDEGTNAIVLLDPVRGEIAMPVINFQKVWKKVDNFTMLAMPK